MTSFAFIFGVLPLAIATGAGRQQPHRHRHLGDRRDADRPLLAIFYIPLFFVLVRRSTRDALKARARAPARRRDGEEPA